MQIKNNNFLSLKLNFALNFKKIKRHIIITGINIPICFPINFNGSILETHQSEIFWHKVKSLEFFSSSKNSIIRIVIPPSECVKLIYQLSNKYKYYLDWGGALMWMEAFELSEEMFESIRKKVVKLGGYVTMIKNSDYLPYVDDVFTINRDRFNISQNIKKSFDPKGILNSGKMYTGI